MPRKTAAAAAPAAAEGGFNEAAARCRGKPLFPGRGSTSRGRFNEAAARCRGKHRNISS